MYFFSVALLKVYDGESDVIGTFGLNSIPKGNYVSSSNRVFIFFGTIWNHYEVNCFDFKLEYLPHSKKLYQIRCKIFSVTQPVNAISTTILNLQVSSL